MMAYQKNSQMILLFFLITLILGGCNWEEGVKKTGEEVDKAIEEGVVEVATIVEGAGDIAAKSLETTKETAEKIIAALDSAIGTLDKNSAEWQTVLKELQSEFTDDIRSTFRVELQNVLSNSIAAIGVEFRCNTDFVGNRVKEQLIQLRAKILGETTIPTFQPTFCEPVPSFIQYLDVIENHTTSVQIYGYNFDNKIPVVLTLENNSATLDVTQYVDYPSAYIITINLGNNGVPLSPDSKRLRITWNDIEISTIGVAQPIPTATFTPTSTPTVTPTKTPTPTSTATPRPTYLLGGTADANSSGGTLDAPNSREVIIDCSPGYVGVGLYGRAGKYIDKLGLICRRLNSDGSLGSGETIEQAGGPGGKEFRHDCTGSNHFLIGVTGKAHDYLDSISGSCRNISNSESNRTSVAGGSDGDGFTSICGQNRVLTGLEIQYGTWIGWEFVYYVQARCTLIKIDQ